MNTIVNVDTYAVLSGTVECVERECSFYCILSRFSTLYSHCLVGRFGPDDNGPSSGNLNMTTTTMSGLLHISAFVLSSIYRTYKKNKRENEID